MLWVEIHLKSCEIDEREKKYVVKAHFETDFLGCTNVIFERARLNKRVQEETELVIDFIEDLNKLAETCQFGALKDELIKDRIVLGIGHIQLSQKLMQDETLTLNKAIKQGRASEMVKPHHEILKGDNDEAKLVAIRGKKKHQMPKSQPGYCLH